MTRKKITGGIGLSLSILLICMVIGICMLNSNHVGRFKDAGTKFDSRDQLGITYKQGNWKITPFIERKGTEGWDKKMTVIGTHFEIKL